MQMRNYRIELIGGVQGLLYRRQGDYEVLMLLVDLTVRPSKVF
jgi:hypothetical protein